MMVIRSIAWNTFREAIRNRVLLNILLFAFVMMIFSGIVGDWSLGVQEKVIKDLGLAAMSIFGLLIAIFIGIRLMVQELEQRTIYIIASKPIYRWKIVVGKFAGLALTIAINVLLMTVMLHLVIVLMQGPFDFSLAPAIALIYLEIMLMVGFSMFFSILMSPQLSAIATLLVFVIGHLGGFLREFIEMNPDNGFHWLFKAIYYIAPNLEKLNLKMAVVDHVPLSPHAFELGLLYGAAYTTLVVMVSAYLFNYKDLK